MPAQGVEVMREQTEQFILENPVSMVFHRQTKVSDGAGGSTYTDSPLPAQTVRVVPQSRLVSVERRNVSGALVKPDANIIAEWDADIQRGDQFTWQGLNMEVVWVSALLYEKICEVAVR